MSGGNRARRAGEKKPGYGQRRIMACTLCPEQRPIEKGDRNLLRLQVKAYPEWSHQIAETVKVTYHNLCGVCSQKVMRVLRDCATEKPATHGE